MALDCDSMRLKTAIEQAQFKKYSEDTKKIASEQIDFFDLATPVSKVLFYKQKLSFSRLFGSIEPIGWKIL